MHGEILCYIAKLLWFIAIVCLINMGLQPFGYNMFETELFLTSLSWVVDPIHYIAGIAGVLGLYRLIMKCMYGKSSSWCGCNGNGACPCGRPNCSCRS